jgi:hypothetical protein
MFATLNTRCAQRIHAATFSKQARSLGIVATETQARAGSLARELAIVTAGFGKRVLLINTREEREFGAQCHTANDFLECAKATNTGYAEVHIARGSEAHRILNDAGELSMLLDKLRERVDAIIFDLPAHDEVMPGVYAPIVVSALDAVMVVALPTVTTSHRLTETLSWIKESGGAVVAVIVNDRFNPTLAEEIVREAGRLARIFPGFPKFVERHTARFPALNRHH